MNLSNKAHNDIQSLRQEVEEWLEFCTPSMLENNPELEDKKELMERFLGAATKILQPASKQKGLR